MEGFLERRNLMHYGRTCEVYWNSLWLMIIRPWMLWVQTLVLPACLCCWTRYCKSQIASLTRAHQGAVGCTKHYQVLVGCALRQLQTVLGKMKWLMISWQHNDDNNRQQHLVFSEKMPLLLMMIIIIINDNEKRLNILPLCSFPQCIILRLVIDLWDIFVLLKCFYFKEKKQCENKSN